MAGVGERLREEREGRSRTIDDLAEASGIDRKYLEALERGEIDALPGRAFGKLYIRAYAEILGFDPRPLIDEYDREQRGPPETREEPGAPSRPIEAAIARWREAKIAERQAAIRPPSAPEPAAEQAAAALEEPPREDAPRPRSPIVPRRLAIALGSIGIVAALAWLMVSSRSDHEAAAPGVAREASAPSSVPVESAPQAGVATPEPEPEPTPAPSRLSVRESGVGRRVVRRQLAERTDRFAQGDVAWFLTQIVGGTAGESVRHVWLHGGEVAYTIDLRLGGPTWRTYSRATLTRSGPWTVEARDATGRVLAREELMVVGSGPGVRSEGQVRGSDPRT